MTYSVDEVKDTLRSALCEVKFTKSNGEERTMRCTLHPSFLPKFEIKEETSEEKKPRKVNPSMVSVWDIEANGWRGFKIESLLTISIIGENF